MAKSIKKLSFWVKYMRDQSKLSHDRISTDFKPIHYESLEHARELKYHYHDFHEIFVLLKGDVSIVIEGRTYHINPGNIVLLHAHDLHRSIIHQTGTYERFFIYVNPFFLEQSSTSQTRLDRCFSPIEDRQSHILSTSLDDVSPFINRIETLYQDHAYGTDLHLTHTFIDFLIFINLWLMKQEELFSIDPQIEHPRIGQVTDYINQHLSEPLNIDQLSADFFISRSSLTREFRRVTGFSIHKYILLKRLLYAKKLLSENKKAIDIYEQCGFVSYHHFIKCFKNQFKITPREFQKTDSSDLNHLI